MMTTQYVTPAQVLAAAMALELQIEDGKQPDPALQAIARAEPPPVATEVVYAEGSLSSASLTGAVRSRYPNLTEREVAELAEQLDEFVKSSLAKGASSTAAYGRVSRAVTVPPLEAQGAYGAVVNTAGDRLGGVGQIYLDDETGEPTWVTVKTGLFGTQESFVPLSDASAQGSDIQVSYDKDTIKNAPRVDADGHLSPDEEQALYDYYGLGGQTTGYTDRVYDTAVGDQLADRDVTTTGDRADVVGHNTSGPTADDAMTLSEERLRVGTERREAGRARLRKYVVTENVTQTVPATREEVRVEREPITDANRGDALSGPDISEEEHEVVLHKERPEVQEAVPVERVRLDTETATEQAQVSEQAGSSEGQGFMDMMEEHWRRRRDESDF